MKQISFNGGTNIWEKIERIGVGRGGRQFQAVGAANAKECQFYAKLLMYDW